jgi:hypothetical protein
VNRVAPARRRRCVGSLSLELVVAIGVLSVAVIPFGYSFVHEQRLIRHAYYRAAALERVDGESEILAAGAIRRFPEGESVYPVTATNLPPGRFLLRRTGTQGSLEWQPEKVVHGGSVRREFHLLVPGGAR